MDLQTILEDPSTGDECCNGNKLAITDVMRTAEDRIYLTVNGVFDLQIDKTDEGIVVNIFSMHPEHDADEPIASTYAFDHEVMTEEQWDEIQRVENEGE